MITQSKNLNLRYALESDAGPLFKYTGDLESSKYLARKPHADKEQTSNMLQRLSSPQSLDLHGLCVWVICLNEQTSPVGILTLIKVGSDMEIHFGLREDFRGQGIASEAISIASIYCRERELAACITSFTDKENVTAQSALVKAGFECTGSLSAFYTAPQLGDEKRDVFSYTYGV